MPVSECGMCPACHSARLLRIQSGIAGAEPVYQCQDCGQQFTTSEAQMT